MEIEVKEFQDERGITVQWNKDWHAAMVDSVIAIICPKYHDEDFLSNVNIVIETHGQEVNDVEALSVINLY